MATYHVTLGGQGYLVDLARYSRRAHQPFAPKTALGDRSYGDLVHDQALRVTGWRGGEGYPRHDASTPGHWRAGSGIDVFSEDGTLRLGPETAAPASPIAANEATACLVYQGLLYVCMGEFLFSWNGSAWTTIGWLGAGRTGRALAIFQGKLYVTTDVDGFVVSWDGTILTPAVWAPPAGTTGSFAMATFYRQAAAYLYWCTQRATNGRVYWWDGGTLSASQYQFEEPRCEAAVVLANRLYFFTADAAARRGGVYSVDDSGSGGVYRAHVMLEGAYFTGAVRWGDAIYAGTGPDGAIYRWDGSALTLVKSLASYVALYGGETRGLAVWNGALWAGILDGAGTLGLLRYDGVGWTRPMVGLDGTAPRGMAVWNNQLHLLASKTGAAKMHRTLGTYRASGYVESGLFDAGLPSVDKVLRSVRVSHSVLASGQSVQVQYQLEGDGAWTVLGSSTTVGSTSATLSVAGTIICKQVAIRLVLAGTAGAASSVVVYDWLLRYALAPDLKREWELQVILEGTAELPLIRLDGTPEPQTGAQLSGGLWALKAQVGPTSFVDLDGASRSVWITELREEVAERSQRRGYHTLGRLKLLEA
ncbi:MAG: hypothetical protein U0821_21325 [Chloroflexota bacterium]